MRARFDAAERTSDDRAPHLTDPIIDRAHSGTRFGNRATGSTVVTARSDEGPAGFLGLSATHVCADPPLMLVSIDKRTSALQTILAARHFALNFLPHEAVEIARHVRRQGLQKGAERFAGGRWGRFILAHRFCLTRWGAIDCRWWKRSKRHAVVMAIAKWWRS